MYLGESVMFLPITYSQCFLFYLEKISIRLQLVNPLRVPLVLTDVTLLWKFLPISYDENTNVETPQMITNQALSCKVKVIFIALVNARSRLALSSRVGVTQVQNRGINSLANKE